jgi:hypothetical protein
VLQYCCCCEGLDPGETFFLTALAISKAPRPFKFREISVSISTRTFVFSIHSLERKKGGGRGGGSGAQGNGEKLKLGIFCMDNEQREWLAYAKSIFPVFGVDEGQEEDFFCMLFFSRKSFPR